MCIVNMLQQDHCYTHLDTNAVQPLSQDNELYTVSSGEGEDTRCEGSAGEVSMQKRRLCSGCWA